MAKKLVRYLLEGDGTVPAFVSNGGYFPVGAELVGVSVDEDQRHVPATVVRMTRADLEARVASMEFRNPETNAVLSEQDKLDKMEIWLEAVGLADLA